MITARWAWLGIVLGFAAGWLAREVAPNFEGNRHARLRDPQSPPAPTGWQSERLNVHHTGEDPHISELSEGQVLKKLESMQAVAPSTAQVDHTVALFRRLARLHPEAALQALDRLKSLALRVRATAAVFGTIAERDPVQAGRWLTARTRGEALIQGSAALASEWATRDPAAAARWAVALPEPAQDRALHEVASAWLSQEPDAALRWIASVTSDESQTELLRDVMRLAGESHSGLAAKWVETLPPGANRSAATEALANSWGFFDPPSAATWIAGQPLDDETLPGVAAVASMWTEQDAPGAWQWATSLAPGHPARRDAIEATALTWLELDPGEALQTVTQSLQADGASLLAEMVSNWSDQDAAAAKNWLIAHPDQARLIEAEAIAAAGNTEPQEEDRSVATKPPAGEESGP